MEIVVGALAGLLAVIVGGGRHSCLARLMGGVSTTNSKASENKKLTSAQQRESKRTIAE